MRHPSPSSHRNYDFEPSPGSTRDPKNSFAFAPDALSSSDVKLMMFAYEGELVYVPSAPDYEVHSYCLSISFASFLTGMSVIRSSQ